jgi:quinolinate synthase
MAESLIEKLARLKRERRAVVLAHNYQRPEVQDAADYVGDSLGLSRQAARTDAEVILFCGVDFMAETAAILCPGKKVLVPDTHAGCPMANMVTVRELRQWKAERPGAAVVCYVNSSAEVKAESDICCTSANAVKVLESIPKEREILFVPDQSLGDYAARKTGRKALLWQGYCPTHHRILAEGVQRARAEHPGAPVVTHPECTRDVLELSDFVASTTGILDLCRQNPAREFIIGTEMGLLHRLRKENPGKAFHLVTPLSDCPNMKLNTLEKMVWSLEDMVYEVRVEAGVAAKARRAIERMLEIA